MKLAHLENLQRTTKGIASLEKLLHLVHRLVLNLERIPTNDLYIQFFCQELMAQLDFERLFAN